MEVNTKKRRKKGEGRESEWEKRQRAEGRPYENNRNVIMAPKQPPPVEVSCRCRYGCRDVNFEHKLKLFTDFYELGDLVKQNSFLMGLISICDIKRRRHGSYESPETSRRQATLFFTIPDGNGNHKQVCKKTFLEVFNITKRRVETLSNAKKRGDLTYIELRGNKNKERKYTAVGVQLICEHIETFPKEESHYTRAKSSNLYLSQDLNFHMLHEAFLEEHPNSKIQYGYYRKIVREKFPKLKFHRPRQDTCNTCDLLKNQMLNDSRNKVQYSNSLEMHHRKAEKAREEMKKDHDASKNPTSEFCTISMDLQQVFSLPTLTHCQMYYLRQLLCFNLGVHMTDNNQAFMFVWHEGISGRGGNEIASCILKGVTCKITNKKKLIIWSDNCCGQNKNKMTLFLWIYLVSRGLFDEIHHKFVLAGHYYLSCDRDFAVIEKRKRIEKCEVPLDLIRVLCNACRKQPYLSTLMEDTDFFDFNKAATSHLTTKTLEISKVVWIKIIKDSPGKVLTKKTFSEIDSWVSTNVFKKGVTSETIKNLDLPQLDLVVTRLKNEKKEDLKKIIPYLKEDNKPFYEQLTAQ